MIPKHLIWRADREAEGARLLSEYSPKGNLGFESPALRQIAQTRPALARRVFFYRGGHLPHVDAAAQRAPAARHLPPDTPMCVTPAFPLLGAVYKITISIFLNWENVTNYSSKVVIMYTVLRVRSS